VDDPHKLSSQPVYDRELGKCLDLNWSYTTRGPKLYPTTLAWFAREHLTPNEPRYRSEGAVLRPVPQVLVPHPLTGGPIATGRRQLLIERRGEEWIDREEVERATLQPAEDEALKDLVRSIGINTLAEQAKVNYRKLRWWLVGKQNLGPRRRAKVLQALHSILSAQAQARTVLRAHPNRTKLARNSASPQELCAATPTATAPSHPTSCPASSPPAPRSPDVDPDRQPALAPTPNTPAVRRPGRPRPGGGGAQAGRAAGRGGPTHHPGTPEDRDRSGTPETGGRDHPEAEGGRTD
jgi:hypothetical protein